MKIKTFYSIGDVVYYLGCFRRVVGIHIYIGKNGISERLYLGDDIWYSVGGVAYEIK